MGCLFGFAPICTGKLRTCFKRTRHVHRDPPSGHTGRNVRTCLRKTGGNRFLHLFGFQVAASAFITRDKMVSYLGCRPFGRHWFYDVVIHFRPVFHFSSGIGFFQTWYHCRIGCIRYCRLDCVGLFGKAHTFPG